MACNTSTAVGLGRIPAPLRPAGPGRHPARAPRRPRSRRATGGSGVIATPATIRSHAYFDAIKDENPAIEVYEHATPTLVPMVEAGMLTGPEAEATVAAALAPLLGERDADGESIFPRPPGRRRSTRCCWAAPTTRCSGRSSRTLAGDRVAIVDSATATASALAELLSVNGLGTTRTAADAGPATSAGRVADPRPAHDRRPDALPRARRAPVRRGRSWRSRRSSWGRWSR